MKLSTGRRLPIADWRSTSLLALLLVSVSPALGDSGLVRFSGPAGSYRLTVFTSPTPFRAGAVEIGVFVQDGDSDRAIPEASVHVEMSPRQESGKSMRAAATMEDGNVMPSARFDLPSGGWWQIRIAVDGPPGKAEKTLDLEADDPLPAWREMSFWIALPVIPVGLYIVHHWLVRRRERM